MCVVEFCEKDLICTIIILMQLIEFFRNNVLDVGGNTNGSFITTTTTNTAEGVPNTLRR